MSMAHGDQGVFTNTVGDSYSGQWRFDRKHGYGVEIWRSERSEYRGHYFEGEREGYGVYYVNGKIVYDGEWHRNLMHGRGKYMIPNSGKVYAGEFYKGHIQGFGTMSYLNEEGRFYEGEFKKDVREGYGFYTWKTTTDDDTGKTVSHTYQGWWHLDKQHGLGVYFNSEDPLSFKYGLW